MASMSSCACFEYHSGGMAASIIGCKARIATPTATPAGRDGDADALRKRTANPTQNAPIHWTPTFERTYRVLLFDADQESCQGAVFLLAAIDTLQSSADCKR